MSKWKLVWSCLPSWKRRCVGCGEKFHPRKHRITHCDICGGEAVKQVPVVYSDLKAVVGDESGCMCEPCPFDIRSRGYATSKEDPYFEGTQCLWHEQVRGKSGTICVSGGTAENPQFVAVIRDRQYKFGLDEFNDYAKKIGAKKL